jgi:NAD(P)-dependent dehydrogenase (short-subunit alcohol dehydrogenase family)
MADGKLAGKWALITGSGRGFGQYIARRFANEGANVVVHYNVSKDGAEQMADEVRSLGREAFVVQGDTTDWEQVKRFVGEAFDHTGRLDVLVNNVGDVAPEQSSWRDLREDLVDRVIATDVKGTLWVTHEVGQRMLDQGGGVIVNICSNVVVMGSQRCPQYAASKYGVLGITKSYAHALAPTVRVNAVGPGWMETSALVGRQEWTPERAKQVLDRTPLGRLAGLEEMTGPVLFLASDDSTSMTGNFVLADCGYSMVGA